MSEPLFDQLEGARIQITKLTEDKMRLCSELYELKGRYSLANEHVLQLMGENLDLRNALRKLTGELNLGALQMYVEDAHKLLTKQS